MSTEDRINLDDLSDAEEDILMAAIGTAIADREEREAQLQVARWDAFAKGRAVGRAERPKVPAEAQTSRRLRDAAFGREHAAVTADPESYPTLRRLRVAKGYTQRELGARIGRSRRCILMAEHTGYTSDLTFTRLAHVLGTRRLGLTVR